MGLVSSVTVAKQGLSSISLQVNDVPVEVVHATVFSRQSWVVLMVDLVAVCSMSE